MSETAEEQFALHGVAVGSGLEALAASLGRDAHHKYSVSVSGDRVRLCAGVGDHLFAVTSSALPDAQTLAARLMQWISDTQLDGPAVARKPIRPSSKPASSTTKSTTKNTTKSTTKPAIKSTTKPAIKSTSKPAIKSTAKPRPIPKNPTIEHSTESAQSKLSPETHQHPQPVNRQTADARPPERNVAKSKQSVETDESLKRLFEHEKNDDDEDQLSANELAQRVRKKRKVEKKSFVKDGSYMKTVITTEWEEYSTDEEVVAAPAIKIRPATLKPSNGGAKGGKKTAGKAGSRDIRSFFKKT